MGRPTLTDGEKKMQLNIRAAPELMAALKFMAKAKGVTVSHLTSELLESSVREKIIKSWVEAEGQ